MGERSAQDQERGGVNHMDFKDCRIGQRVYHEPENNAALWRGMITQVQDNGFVFVKWDDDSREVVYAARILQPEQ